MRIATAGHRPRVGEFASRGRGGPSVQALGPPLRGGPSGALGDGLAGGAHTLWWRLQSQLSLAGSWRLGRGEPECQPAASVRGSLSQPPGLRRRNNEPA
eukprot:4881487-Lingulodinium_polyedra.AAC.1